jgi:hypothetical protein
MRTGHPPGLLQDDCRALHKWFASRVDARWVVRRWFGDATQPNHTTYTDRKSQLDDSGRMRDDYYIETRNQLE